MFSSETNSLLITKDWLSSVLGSRIQNLESWALLEKAEAGAVKKKFSEPGPVKP